MLYETPITHIPIFQHPRIQRRVVIHLHLLVDLHHLLAGFIAFHQLVDSSAKVCVLLLQNAKFFLALGLVLFTDIGAFHLGLHVVYLQLQN